MTYHISQISGARSGEISRQIEGDAPEGVPGGVGSGPGRVDSGALDEMTLAPLASSAERGARAPAAPAAPPGASIHAEAEVDALSLDELRSLIAKAGLPL